MIGEIAKEYKITKFIIKIYSSLYELVKYYKISNKYKNDKNDIINEWAELIELIENHKHGEIYDITKETKELVERYNTLKTRPYVDAHFDYFFKMADIFAMYCDDMNLVLQIHDQEIVNEYNQHIRDICIHEMIIMTERYNKHIYLLNTIFKDTNTRYARNTIKEHFMKCLQDALQDTP